MINFSNAGNVGFGDIVTVILAALGALVSWLKALKAKKSEDRAKKYLDDLKAYYSEAAEFYKSRNEEKRKEDLHPWDSGVLDYLKKVGEATASSISRALEIEEEQTIDILNRLHSEKKIRKNKDLWISIK